jgi:hypothetical protein
MAVDELLTKGNAMDREVVIVAVMVFLAAVAGCAGGVKMAVGVYRQQAIERGYAEHDAKTGEWKWIEPQTVEP